MCSVTSASASSCRVLCVIVLAVIGRGCVGQEEGEGPYRGKYIGKLNSYHHQVSGSVYAVDEWTLLLVELNYDGTGDDAFFWAGESARPGPQGFIVPDERGTTNVLERYYNAEVRLRLPDGKRVSRIKWLAIYDIDSQNAFGDVYVPDEFEPPAPRLLAALASTPGAGPSVSSQPLRVLTAHTIMIPEFRYNGSGEEVYFWTGVGPQPSSKGMKIPDENGYLEPLGAYDGSDVVVRLPGGRDVFAVSWVAVWDARRREALAAVLLPDALNVPPGLARVLPHRPAPRRCRQLHRDYQVAWEVFGPAVTIELAARIAPDEYMAFGISGSETSSTMLGADVAVAWWDARQQRGQVLDYNVTARARCTRVLDAWQGVCRDTRLQGLDSNQVFTASRADGLTVVTYRRSLQPDEPLDKEWSKDREMYAVWAIGRLDSGGEPGFHRLYHKHDLKIHLDLEQDDCFPFIETEEKAPPAWETAQLFDPALRVFRFTVGPSGGQRGLAGRGPEGGAPDAGAAPLAWYVNGQLAPDLQLRRGLAYSFESLGGNDPHSPTEYHPLVVRTDSGGVGGEGRALAGVQYSRRGQPHPTAAGPLCLAAPTTDRRRDHNYPTFRSYNRSLAWRCPPAAPAKLLISPNSSWPDVVYYDSYTTTGMGGRIFVVDRHKRALGRRSAAPSPPLAPLLLLTAVTSHTIHYNGV